MHRCGNMACTLIKDVCVHAYRCPSTHTRIYVLELNTCIYTSVCDYVTSALISVWLVVLSYSTFRLNPYFLAVRQRKEDEQPDWSVSRSLWMHHSRPFQKHLRHHQKSLSYTAERNSHTIQGYGNAIARKYFLDCADTECTYNSATMAATVRRPLSSYLCTDTFTNSLRSKLSTKKLCNNIPVITSIVECSSVTTNLTDLLRRGAHLHKPTTVTGLRWWRCTGCTPDPFTPSAGTVLQCKKARLICSTSSALGNNNTFSNPATGSAVDKHDGHFLSVGHHRTETYLTLALRGLSNMNSTGQLTQNQSALHHGRREYVLNHLQYTASYAGDATLRRTTKYNIYGTFISPSPARLSSSIVDTLRIRPFGAQSESMVGRCDWLVSVEEEGFASFSRMSGATRSFFFTKKTKADSSNAAPSSGSAAVAGRQSSANANTLEATSVNETSKMSNAVDTKGSGKEAEGTIQPAKSDISTHNEGFRPWSTKLRTLPVGPDARNNGISQLEIYEEERKLVSDGKTSALSSFLFSTKGRKKDRDAFPGESQTVTVKEKKVTKTAKIPLSKKFTSFMFGFFLASGCSFFILYCHVADATLILQQTAKDASHRLAILESRILELEKRCHC